MPRPRRPQAPTAAPGRPLCSTLTAPRPPQCCASTTSSTSEMTSASSRCTSHARAPHCCLRQSRPRSRRCARSSLRYASRSGAAAASWRHGWRPCFRRRTCSRATSTSPPLRRAQPRPAAPARAWTCCWRTCSRATARSQVCHAPSTPSLLNGRHGLLSLSLSSPVLSRVAAPHPPVRSGRGGLPLPVRADVAGGVRRGGGAARLQRHVDGRAARLRPAVAAAADDAQGAGAARPSQTKAAAALPEHCAPGPTGGLGRADPACSVASAARKLAAASAARLGLRPRRGRFAFHPPPRRRGVSSICYSMRRARWRNSTPPPPSTSFLPHLARVPRTISPRSRRDLRWARSCGRGGCGPRPSRS